MIALSNVAENSVIHHSLLRQDFIENLMGLLNGRRETTVRILINLLIFCG